MTSDTQRLAEKQKVLMGNIKKLEPMMQKAGAMLDGLDMQGMQGMQHVQGVLGLQHVQGLLLRA